MGIQDIETASAFGALDGDALTDGRALDAHTLRTMALQANRLVSKQQQIACLVWPDVATTVEGVSQQIFEQVATFDAFAPIAPPIMTPKCPGLTTGKVYIRAKIASGAKAVFSAQTTIEGPPDRHTVTATGTGAFANYTITGVEFQPGPIDTLTISARGDTARGNLANTGTYGTPNSSSGAVSATLSWRRDALIHTTANWTVGPPNLATAGHYIQVLEDYGGSNERVLFRRRITGLPLVDRLEWAPELGDELYSQLVAKAANSASTIQYEIREGATPFSVSQILAVLDARVAP